MMSNHKARTHTVAITLAFLFATCASAQTPTPAPPNIPLPSALTTAKTLFIGNAGDQQNADCLRVYNDFYAGIANLKRFQLVTDPNQADLILELHYEIALGQSVDNNNSYIGDKPIRQFRVAFIDLRSHAILWALTERTNFAILQSNRDKDLDQTIATLVSDVNSLLSSVPPNNKSVVTHE